MRMRSAFGAVIFMATGVLAGGEAAAQLRWPQIGAADLQACKAEIREFHRREIAYRAELVAEYCGPSSDSFAAQNCATVRGGMQQSIATDDISWFLKGNERCEGSDYTCFGVSLHNQDRSREADGGQGWIQDFREDAAENAAPYDSTFSGYYRVVHGCVARVWVQKFDTLNGGGQESAGQRMASSSGMSQMGGGDSGGGFSGGNTAAGSGTDDGDRGDENSTSDTIDMAALPDSQGGQSGDGGDAVYAGPCREALAAQDAEINDMTNRMPKDLTAAGIGTKALIQVSMYVLDQRMKLLDAKCKGQPEYAAYPGLKQSYDSAMTSCTQVSSDGGVSCVPLKAW